MERINDRPWSNVIIIINPLEQQKDRLLVKKYNYQQVIKNGIDVGADWLKRIE
jgi:hypothetical protein